MNIRVVKNWNDTGLNEYRTTVFHALSDGVWYHRASDTVILIKSELTNAELLPEEPTFTAVAGYDTSCFED